jgi:hypothetical protein
MKDKFTQDFVGIHEESKPLARLSVDGTIILN